MRFVRALGGDISAKVGIAGTGGMKELRFGSPRFGISAETREKLGMSEAREKGRNGFLGAFVAFVVGGGDGRIRPCIQAIKRFLSASLISSISSSARALLGVSMRGVDKAFRFDSRYVVATTTSNMVPIASRTSKGELVCMVTK